MPKFLDNIEFYTEGYNTESLTIEKETKDVVLSAEWNEETISLEIPSETIIYPAENPAKKKITDISRDIEEKKDEAVYKIGALSEAGLNATNNLVQKGLDALNDKTQTGLTVLQNKIDELDPDKIAEEITALQQFDEEHDNIENGEGQYSIQTKDSVNNHMRGKGSAGFGRYLSDEVPDGKTNAYNLLSGYVVYCKGEGNSLHGREIGSLGNPVIGNYNLVGGFGISFEGDNNIIGGSGNRVKGRHNIIGGNANNCEVTDGLIGGHDNTIINSGNIQILGNNSIVEKGCVNVSLIGEGLIAKEGTINARILGDYNDPSTYFLNPSIVISAGQGSTSRLNAFEIQRGTGKAYFNNSVEVAVQGDSDNSVVIKKTVSDLEEGLREGTFKPKIAQYASEDTSKGTIEERLTNLAYKGQTVNLTKNEDLVVNGGFTELAKCCFCFTTSSSNLNIKGLILPAYAKGTWIGTVSDIVVIFDAYSGQQESWFYNANAGAWTPNSSLYAKYASEDTSKGTIEERFTTITQRLADLGFKSGYVYLMGVDIAVNSLRRQGNYVIGSYGGTLPDWLDDNGSVTGSIVAWLAPKEDVRIRSYVGSSAYNRNGIAEMLIQKDGKVTLSWFGVVPSGDISINFSNFGYEAAPL